VSQHEGTAKAHDLEHLSDAIAAAERGTLLILDADGLTLTRIWCLFELYKTVKLRPTQSDLIVLLPPAADFRSLSKIWTSLDVEKAQATVEDDRVRILHEIAQSEAANEGTLALNHTLKHAIQRSAELRLENARRTHRPNGADQHLLIEALELHALMLRLSGALPQAVPLMQEAILLRESRFQQQHNHTSRQEELHTRGDVTRVADGAAGLAYCYGAMGSVLREMGDLKGALTLNEKCFSLYQQEYGEHSAFTATARNNLAMVLQLLGQTSRALVEFQASLTVMRSLVAGENAADLASLYVNIGNLFLQQEDLENAETHLRQALEIDLKFLGPDHPNVAGDYNHMAQVMEQQKKFDAALEHIDAALRIRMRTLANDAHPDVTFTLQCRGTLLCKMGRKQEAKEAFEEALKGRIHTLGLKHPAVAETQLAIVNLREG
jgi:tetratricopeptide (TPR) repeat protein